MDALHSRCKGCRALVPYQHKKFVNLITAAWPVGILRYHNISYVDVFYLYSYRTLCQSILDYEYLREFEVKIENVLSVVWGSRTEPIYFKKSKNLSYLCDPLWLYGTCIKAHVLPFLFVCHESWPFFLFCYLRHFEPHSRAGSQRPRHGIQSTTGEHGNGRGWVFLIRLDLYYTRLSGSVFAFGLLIRRPKWA